MSSEAISQLEMHIAECNDCTQFIEAKKRTLHEVARTRQAAIAIPESFPSQPPEPEPSPAPAAPRNPAATALIQAIREKANPLSQQAVLETAREPKAPRKKHWKALGYSAALGAVLLAMSHISANPTAIFGERVGAADASEKADGEGSKSAESDSRAIRDPFEPGPIPSSPADASRSNPDVAGPIGTANAGSTPEKPKTDPEVASTPETPPTISTSTPNPPQTSVRSRRPTRPARRMAATPSRPGRTGNSIRVYDANGKPIQ